MGSLEGGDFIIDQKLGKCRSLFQGRCFTALSFLTLDMIVTIKHPQYQESKHQYMNWCRQFMHVKYKPWYPVHAIKT